MGRRKGAKALSVDDMRDTMLRGISSEQAVMLYDSCMKQLADRGDASYIAALQLRDAAQWTEAIADIQRELIRVSRDPNVSSATVRGMMRNKQAAEEARRRILDGLLLIPQRPRGRPRTDEEKRDQDESEGDAWDDFDLPETAGGGDDEE